jgi:hypothetical protein
MAIFSGVAMFANYRWMKKENRKKKKKRKRKEEWKREEWFCGGCGEFAGCGLWSFAGRRPIGDLLQSAWVGWCWGCGIVWI